MAARDLASGGRPAAVSAAEAVSSIKPGERIFMGGIASPPDALIEALVARADRLRDVEIVQLTSMTKVPYAAPELARSFRVTTLFVGPDLRLPVAEGRADFVPVFLSEASRALTARYPLDWALVQLSPPDAHGFCSIGISADATLAAIRQARHVAAEINPRMPRTLGDTLVPAARLDRMTEVDRPVFELPPPPITDVARRISEQVADIIGDGDCLQIGIGGIPNMVLELIKDRRHLGVHTEMLTDGIVGLYQAPSTAAARPSCPARSYAPLPPACASFTTL